MCQNCGTEACQNIQNATALGFQACGAPLKGPYCKSKPGRDGHCWRHNKQLPQQEDDNNTLIRGEIVVKETMKKLRQAAKCQKKLVKSKQSEIIFMHIKL